MVWVGGGEGYKLMLWVNDDGDDDDDEDENS